MRLIRIIYLILLTLTVASCSEEEGFRITGIIEGLGDTAVDIYYYSGGGIKSERALSKAGKFKIPGRSAVPALVTLSIPSSGIVTYVIAEDGNDIEIKGNIDSPLEWKISGNKAASKMAAFVSDNSASIAAGDRHGVNTAISEYICSNKSSLTSGALLVTRFYVPGYEILADSLLSLLTPEARPAPVMQNFATILSRQLSSEANKEVSAMALYAGRDSTVRLTPSRQSYFLLAFVGDASSQRDTIIPQLRDLTEKYPRRRFKALEISMAPDSASWRRSADGDSARWLQAWLPGNLAATQIRRLSVPAVPYFIVCDSTGRQIFRGSSIASASQTISSSLAGKVSN